jgi:hypothetical protein
MSAVASKICKSFPSRLDVIYSWTNWLENEAPLSDDVNEYIRCKPLRIPFADILFGSDTRREIVSHPDIATSVQVADVLAGPSVVWSNRGRPSETTSPRRNLDGSNLIEYNATENDTGGRKRSRVLTPKLEDILQPSKIIFVPANSWPEYSLPGRWPYPHALESSFFKGVVGEFMNSNKKKIRIVFEAFDQLFFADLNWAKKYGLLLEVPLNSHIITEEEYQRYELVD